MSPIALAAHGTNDANRGRLARLWWGSATWVLIGLGSVPAARAGDDDLLQLTPPLDAPAEPSFPRLVNPTRIPIISTPAPATARSVPHPGSTSPAVGSPPPPGSASPPRAVLAIPGFAGPGSVLRPMPTFGLEEQQSLEPLADAESTGSELTLDGPVEMPDGPTPRPRDRFNSFGDAGAFTAPPLTPIDDSLANDYRDLGPLPAISTRSSSTSARRSEPASPSAREGARTVSPTSRRRFFGLFPGPVPASPQPSPDRTPPAGTATGDGKASIDHLSPAAIAESRLKQRIEKQARDVVGDRARTIEVKVAGKSASVHVRGVKFYQKRGVRRTLEAIPALTGLRSTIEVSD